MILVADENIPYAQQLFSHVGEVRLLPGRTMTPGDVKDADILLVRSVTAVNEQLLSGSNVKFVGTCTIGTDHLDKAYLEKQGIHYASAPGCNAYGVVQYVLGALANLDKLNAQTTVSIVGCGNVGGRLYKALKAIGLTCYCVDPFKTREELPDLAGFDAVYTSDVVCVHTPLTVDGPHPTKNLFNAEVLGRLKDDVVLLNAGRGDVIDNIALLERIKSTPSFKGILDVWQGEPNINLELFDYLTFGTPHIAGYSYEGRVNGSFMIFSALTEYLNWDLTQSEKILQDIKTEAFGEPVSIAASDVQSTILSTYDIAEDDQKLRESKTQMPSVFDQLRKNYPKRRELSHFRLTHVAPEVAATLSGIGFLLHD